MEGERLKSADGGVMLHWSSTDAPSPMPQLSLAAGPPKLFHSAFAFARAPKFRPMLCDRAKVLTNPQT